jgi:hypothetical protein
MAFVPELDSERSLTIAAGRSGPPPELLAQMLRAGEIYDDLRQRGRVISFSAAQQPVVVELHDEHGASTRGLSVTEAVELAAGSTAE